MATIVGGFASSHTPLMSLPGQDWAKRAEDDKRNRELIRARDGAHVTYDELLASADPAIAAQIDEDSFCRKYAAIQHGLDALDQAFTQGDPDVVVMFGDDQDEMLFEDNYQMISVYWGEILTHYPRSAAPRPNMSEAMRIAAAVYGTKIIDYPRRSTAGTARRRAIGRARLRRRQLALHEVRVRRHDRPGHVVSRLQADHQSAPAGHGPRVFVQSVSLVRRQAAADGADHHEHLLSAALDQSEVARLRWAAPCARPS
jgi:hypothetical protein